MLLLLKETETSKQQPASSIRRTTQPDLPASRHDHRRLDPHGGVGVHTGLVHFFQHPDVLGVLADGQTKGRPTSQNALHRGIVASLLYRLPAIWH